MAYWTPRETMAHLNVRSQSALYRLIKQHQLPFCRIGRQYRFDPREVDAWAHGHGSALEFHRASRKTA